MIDLHLHTTTSDGRCTPHELVHRAAAAGLTVLAVTDHDTTDATADVRAGAIALGMTAIPGIEITAVEDGSDVHVLGYFADPAHDGLQAFLERQRTRRVARVKEIAARLSEAGMPIDLDRVLADVRQHGARAVGRPQVARAMIEAGYVTTVQDAFDRWLGRGRRAFVEREGETPETVIEIVHEAGGLASLAHPGRTQIDARIEALRDAGLDALEAHHSDHDPAEVARYRALAHDLGLLITGGSDFHDDPARPIQPGTATLPPADWERLLAARERHA